ncbi:MAG: hypothetical protein J6Y43_05460, partial [Clostridia bacterium]|nr:hypothetical protein [Clostridia bacterium]
RMKKTVKRITVLTITAFLCFAFSIANFKAENAFAAVVNNSVYSDEFNSESGELNGELVPFGGAGIKTDYTAMRLNSDDYEWGAHIVNGGYKLEYDKIDTFCTVEFTLNRIDESGAWLAFSYGVEDVLYGFPYSSGALIFYSEKSNLFKSVNGALANADGAGYLRDFTIFHGKKVKVSLQFEKIVDETGNYYLSATCTDARTEEIITTHNYGKVYIADGYFGFNSSAMKVDIFEFAVYENGESEPAFYDDFNNSAVSYMSGGVDNPVWYATNFWNKSNLIVGRIGRLDITKPGSGVVYKEPVENADDKGLNLLYTLSANFHVGEMQNFAESGFIIGADKNGNGGAFIGVSKNLTNYELVFRNDGEESLKVGNFTDSVINIVVNIFYDKKAEIKADGESYRFGLNSVSGYVGFKTIGEEDAVGAYADNFSYENSEYVERKSPDAKTDFEDVIKKETEIATVYDYYCSSKNWYKSSDISLPFIVRDNGYLIFSNAGDYCCFAPKKKYNDFIVRFDVKFTVIEDGNIFGIEVGKTDISESCTNSVYVGFQNRGTETYCISNKCVSDEGLTAKPLISLNGTPENIFTEGETYNVMVIARNGVITLHVKNANESESVLSYVRAKFENVNTDGYVAMFAANGISLQLDNFSVINLDYEYFTIDKSDDESLRTFRYDFSQGSVIRDFSAFFGGTFGKDKTVKIIRGTDGVITVGKVGANITRLRFDEIEGGASYKHGAIVVNVNEAQGKITVSDGITDYAIELENDFVYSNALFEIEETFGKISVS